MLKVLVLFSLLSSMVCYGESEYLASKIRCTRDNASYSFIIDSDGVPLVENTSCYQSLYYNQNKIELVGVMCVSERTIFLSYPNGDNWNCTYAQQYRQWACRGANNINGNRQFYMQCIQF